MQYKHGHGVLYYLNNSLYILTVGNANIEQ